MFLFFLFVFLFVDWRKTRRKLHSRLIPEIIRRRCGCFGRCRRGIRAACEVGAFGYCGDYGGEKYISFRYFSLTFFGLFFALLPVNADSGVYLFRFASNSDRQRDRLRIKKQALRVDRHGTFRRSIQITTKYRKDLNIDFFFVFSSALVEFAKNLASQ